MTREYYPKFAIKSSKALSIRSLDVRKPSCTTQENEKSFANSATIVFLFLLLSLSWLTSLGSLPSEIVVREKKLDCQLHWKSIAMGAHVAFSSPVGSGSFVYQPRFLQSTCRGHVYRAPNSQSKRVWKISSAGGAEEPLNNEQGSAERMRRRLEGLFGAREESLTKNGQDTFDGVALRTAIRERWGVEYDVQPQKRHGRVYVQIMWRYFEQQSFYMEEDEFACHCEAVAQLLQRWDAVDYFCDYISSVKKRPVVGITINIPIPGVDASKEVLE